jgi:hypothetical protein
MESKRSLPVQTANSCARLFGEKRERAAGGVGLQPRVFWSAKPCSRRCRARCSRAGRSCANAGKRRGPRRGCSGPPVVQIIRARRRTVWIFARERLPPNRALSRRETSRRRGGGYGAWTRRFGSCPANMSVRIDQTMERGKLNLSLSRTIRDESTKHDPTHLGLPRKNGRRVRRLS